MRTRGWPDGDNVISTRIITENTKRNKQIRQNQQSKLHPHKPWKYRGGYGHICSFCGDTTVVTRILIAGKWKKVCEDCKPKIL